jgi:ribonuclease HI
MDEIAPLLGCKHRQTILQSTRGGGHDTTQLVQRSWSIIKRMTLHQLWLHRNAAAHRDIQTTSHMIANQIVHSLYHHMERLAEPTWLNKPAANRQRLRALVSSLRNTRHTLTDYPSDSARLYYDGGSRGNPGIAGAGAVILIKRQDKWCPLWWDSHYVGGSVTNNRAEYTALYRGLQAWRGLRQNALLQIVGDSMLVTNQVTGRQASLNVDLRALAHQVHDLLMEIPFYTIHHTLRSGNKMADWLANKAMDTKRTKTSSCWTDQTPPLLTQHQQTDTPHPWSPRQCDTRLPRHITTRLLKHQSTQGSRSSRPRPAPDELPDSHAAKRRRKVAG